MSDGWRNERLPDMSFNHGVLKQIPKCDVMCVDCVFPFTNKHTIHDLNEMMMMKWLLLNQSNHQRGNGGDAHHCCGMWMIVWW
jgi:hypothetical protein